MVKLHQALTLASLTITMSIAAFAEPITIFTEENPPYSYSKNGKVTGIATDIVKSVLSDLKNTSEIKMYPWARAYHRALTESNVLIFGIDRTPEREDLFKWIGYVSRQNRFLFAE